MPNIRKFQCKTTAFYTMRPCFKGHLSSKNLIVYAKIHMIQRIKHYSRINFLVAL